MGNCGSKKTPSLVVTKLPKGKLPKDMPVGCILANSESLGGLNIRSKAAFSHYCMSVWPYLQLDKPGDFWLPQGSIDLQLIEEVRTTFLEQKLYAEIQFLELFVKLTNSPFLLQGCSCEGTFICKAQDPRLEKPSTPQVLPEDPENDLPPPVFL